MSIVWRLPLPLTIGLLCMVLAGCTSATPSSGESSPDFGSITLKEAQKYGADPSQITILEKGEVSYPDYEAAVNRSLQCMRDAGISVIDPVPNNNEGITLLNYGWSSTLPGMTEDQGYALGDDCLKRFSYWVEQLYQLQPSSLEAMERHFDQYRDAVVQCIRTNGGTVRDDATRDEAALAAIDVENQTGVDCFRELGLSL